MVAYGADGTGVGKRAEAPVNQEDEAFSAGYFNRPMPDSAKGIVKLMRAYGDGQDAYEQDRREEFIKTYVTTIEELQHDPDGQREYAQQASRAEFDRVSEAAKQFNKNLSDEGPCGCVR